MSDMFCFQCEQTSGGRACVKKTGVCGKQEETSVLQDKLTGALIGLARAVEDYGASADMRRTRRIVIEGLFATLTNVNFDDEILYGLIEKVRREKEAVSGGSGTDSEDYDLADLWAADNDIRSLKSLILFGVRGVAAYAYHALVLGYSDETVNAFFYKALAALGNERYGMETLLALVMETGAVNLKCMELLDRANTETFGTPQPVSVPLGIEKGPFIVVSGHDLRDLKLLLEQTDGKGINIYTHGEMLPAHAYPELKKHTQLKGNFGGAWQNQQTELDGIPAPVLFTTNCLMPVKTSYSDRVFTTSLVGYPGVGHIDEDEDFGSKDFTPLIDKALELGGYTELRRMTGPNGGTELMTGFAHGAVLAVAGTVIDAVKSGAIRHFFLVGGCDGARPGRDYYAEFVRRAPEDTVILTLACGKFRFNDMNIGNIGPLPRIMDMGQCNDAYSAIKVAVALAEAFGCGVNELPLTLVLSWYEQKAVAILLTLLHLGIKNILLGPSLPAFVSPNVLTYLVEHFGIAPISTPERDMAKALGR